MRRDEQVQLLKKEEGAEHVLNSESPTFEAELKELIEKLQPTFYFSAIGGGKTPEFIFLRMPKGSTVYIYGLLGGEPFSFINWIFHMKTVTYFWVGVWLGKLTAEERQKWFATVATDLGSDAKIFGSTIQKTFPLAEFEAAIKTQKENATAGKSIIHPHD